jgi:uncharacterized RDD family membrane protein YckC
VIVSSPASPSNAELIPVGPRDPEMRYVGLATRVLSFVIDAAVITAVAIFVGVGAFLVQGVLHLPSNAQKIIQLVGAGAYVIATIAYFVAFWSSTGQTPGARVMQIQVVTDAGARLNTRRALARCGGVVVAALPLFAGFLPILYDARRRGLQDWVARTCVVEAQQRSIAAERRLQRRAAGRTRSAG